MRAGFRADGSARACRHDSIASKSSRTFYSAWLSITNWHPSARSTCSTR